MTAATLAPVEPLFFTAPQLAERWATTTGHLANLRSKRLPPVYTKFGASVRYNRADIEAYEQAQRVLPVL